MALLGLSKLCGERLREIFVGKLPDNTTEDEIKRYFSKYGALIDIKMYKQFKNTAFVTFEKSDVAQSLLNQNVELDFNGTPIVISGADPLFREAKMIYNAYLLRYYTKWQPSHLAERTSEREQPGRKIFVSGLPDNVSAEDLDRYFSKYGLLTDITIPEPYRNFAFVTFNTSNQTSYVLQPKLKHEINGTPIHISEALSEPRDTIEEEDVEGSPTAADTAYDSSKLATDMGVTLRLLKCLERARGHESSMVSLYLNNADSLPDDASIEILIEKLEREFECTTESGCEMTANHRATQETIMTIKNRIELNGRTSRRGIVIFCGTIITEAGEPAQVLLEFEPYNIISVKTFCYIDNKFHMGPLAFRLLHFRMHDGLRASEFKKVAEAFSEDTERMLANFNGPPIDQKCDSPNDARLVTLFYKDFFHFNLSDAILPCPQDQRLAEVIRTLQLIESLRVSRGEAKTKKIIRIVAPRDPVQPHPSLDFKLEFTETGGNLSEYESFKQCFDFAEERFKSYDLSSLTKGLIIYCSLGLDEDGKEVKFSRELEPYRRVTSDRIIYMKSGRFNLEPLEDLILHDDLLVSLVLNPKNLPPETISNEKRDVLIELVAELGDEFTAIQPTSCSIS